jgi:hypothetical protein
MIHAKRLTTGEKVRGIVFQVGVVGEFLNHPCECDVWDSVSGISAADSGMVAWEPALLQSGFGIVGSQFPKGGSERRAMFVQRQPVIISIAH